jgi:hypothetical protein
MTDNIIPSPINNISLKEEDDNMVKQTVPLSQFMMIDMAVDSVKKRLSQWPTQVVDLGSGGAGAPDDGAYKIDQTKSSNTNTNTNTSDENAYYQNAAVVAFLLLEHIHKCRRS